MALEHEKQDANKGTSTFTVNLGCNEQSPHECLILVLALSTSKGESSWTAHACAKTDAFVTQTRAGGDPCFTLTYTDRTDKKLLLRRCVLKENFNLKKIKRKIEQCLNLYFS